MVQAVLTPPPSPFGSPFDAVPPLLPIGSCVSAHIINRTGVQLRQAASQDRSQQPRHRTGLLLKRRGGGRDREHDRARGRLPQREGVEVWEETHPEGRVHLRGGRGVRCGSSGGGMKNDEV